MENWDNNRFPVQTRIQVARTNRRRVRIRNRVDISHEGNTVRVFMPLPLPPPSPVSHFDRLSRARQCIYTEGGPPPCSATTASTSFSCLPALLIATAIFIGWPLLRKRLFVMVWCINYTTPWLRGREAGLCSRKSSCSKRGRLPTTPLGQPVWIENFRPTKSGNFFENWFRYGSRCCNACVPSSAWSAWLTLIET